jgi:hypothetical protein
MSGMILDRVSNTIIQHISRLALDVKHTAQYTMAGMATTTIQAPAAPPTPNVCTTRNPSSLASMSATTVQSGLTRRQTSLASSGASITSISPPATTPGQQRPNPALQTTIRPPTPTSTPAQLSNTSSQVQQFCSPISGSPTPSSPTSNSLISSSIPSRQSTPSPQTPITPKASSSALRNLVQRVPEKLGVWTTIGLTTITIIVAIYYGAIMLSYAKWTKHNDFREGCISDREHELLLSAECLQELLRPRASPMKRQIEVVHVVFSKERDILLARMEIAGSFVLGLAIGVSLDSLSKVKNAILGFDIGATFSLVSKKSVLLQPATARSNMDPRSSTSSLTSSHQASASHQTQAMQIYFGLAAWGVVALPVYKVINLILARRQLAGM